jgi:hypothetical protein
LETLYPPYLNIPSFGNVSDDFVQKKTRFESSSRKEGEVEGLALIVRMRKGGKK